MKYRQRRIAILTDYLLHPQNDQVPTVAENQLLLNLINLLRNEEECQITVYQNAAIKEREFNGVKVYGIDTRIDNLGMFPGLNSAFAQLGLGYDLAIYYHWHVAFPVLVKRAVVVSHGVFWDSPVSTLNQLNPIDREEWRKRHLYGIAASRAFVVEDRSTANVIKALWPGYEHKLHYLPPGVALDIFKPKTALAEGGPLKIICPQDFTEDQGVLEIIKLARAFLTCYPQVEFHLVGQMKDFETAVYLASKVRQLPNTKFYWAPLAKLPELYQQADMAFLPSRATEGAALYCLQAMACGLPIVAGLAGGLSEWVHDGWNGRLVQPELPYFEAALRQLVANPALRLEMGENSRRLATGYPLINWKKRWERLLNAVFDPGRSRSDE
jgi:glycosyltransferase involved in cell wall biosynthesis